VRLTDIYGRFATRAKVVLVRASSGTQVDSARLVLSNQNLVPADEKDARNTLYSLNFLASKPDKGYYALEFRVVPEDSAFSTIDSAVRIIKVPCPPRESSYSEIYGIYRISVKERTYIITIVYPCIVSCYSYLSLSIYIYIYIYMILSIFRTSAIDTHRAQ
jgi:hypothetical protein